MVVNMEQNEFSFINPNFDLPEKTYYTYQNGSINMEYHTDDRGFVYETKEYTQNKDEKINKEKPSKHTQTNCLRKSLQWSRILQDYASVSTFHGLINIAASQPFIIRR